MNIDRQADLHYAFQFGQDAARGNANEIKGEFAAKFVGDLEAQTQFDKGFAGESAKVFPAVPLAEYEALRLTEAEFKSVQS